MSQIRVNKEKIEQLERRVRRLEKEAGVNPILEEDNNDG